MGITPAGVVIVVFWLQECPKCTVQNPDDKKLKNIMQLVIVAVAHSCFACLLFCSLRAIYGTDSLMNAVHGCDSSDKAAR